MSSRIALLEFDNLWTQQVKSLQVNIQTATVKIHDQRSIHWHREASPH